MAAVGLGSLDWVTVALAVATLAALAGVYQLLVQHGRLLLRVERIEEILRGQGLLGPQDAPAYDALPHGTVLNDFALPRLGGGTMTLSEWRGRRVLLAFVNPACSFSRDLVKRLAAAGGAHSSDPALLFVSTGSTEANREMFAQLPDPVVLQEDSELSELYQVRGTPVGILVDENGAVSGPTLAGLDPILAAAGRGAAGGGGRAAVSPLSRSRLVRDGLKAGVPAPDFTLPRLGGGALSLSEYRGREVLLLFSDPDCAPCALVAPEVDHIHRTAGIAAIMISRGSEEANREKAAELGLAFPIALQRHWEISKQYGIFATPVAYRIGADGTIAANVAVGGGPILELASKMAAAHGRQLART